MKQNVIHLIESEDKLSNDIPNPFERRRYAFRVLPEEKDPMQRANHYSFILPTLKLRLQQLICTPLWEYMMFSLSIWSFIPLLFQQKLRNMRMFFEVTHEISQATLFIEVFCKLYADWYWFCYDTWNFYDLICVILNSPIIFNLNLSDYLGMPTMTSFHRIFRVLHALRLIRIHSRLRFVVETMFIALTNIYNTLLLELVVVTVFALLSIAFAGDTPFWDTGEYEPYENYTEALYSYYMCITFEGVNEVAEQILQLDSPRHTTAIGLFFYIFGAMVTYSVGQLLAAVIATTLGKAMDRVTREKSLQSINYKNTKLIGLKHPTINDKLATTSRCRINDEIKNFSNLKPDDLPLLIIIFQNLDRNLSEYDQIVSDMRQINEHINESNAKKHHFNSLHNQKLSMRQNQLREMINSLNKILYHLNNKNELSSPLGEFLLNEIETISNHHADIDGLFKSTEEKLLNIENIIKRNNSNTERNQRHLIIIDRFKQTFYKNIQNNGE